MNRHESKYFNTAFLFDEALILLLEKKDIEYITIKEICEYAGVNRSTFYLHYESINDLLDETLNYIINKLINHFKIEPKEFIDNINNSDKEDLKLINVKYLKPYLEFIKDNKRVFISAFKNSITMKSNEKYYNLERYVLNPILDKFEIPDYKKKFILRFYINGIMGIIQEWILNDCDEKIENIINIIMECVKQ